MRNYEPGTVHHLLNVAPDGLYSSCVGADYTVKIDGDLYLIFDPEGMLDNLEDMSKAAKVIKENDLEIVPVEETYGTLEDYLDVEQDTTDFTFVSRF